MKKVLVFICAGTLLFAACGESAEQKAKRDQAIIDSVLNAYQNKKASPTTMDEFNYVVSGYSIQQKSGLDMKAGYEVEDVDIYTYEFKPRIQKIMNCYTIKRLKRTETNETAAYMIIYKPDEYGSDSQYICIPSPTSDRKVINKSFCQLNDENITYIFLLTYLSVFEW